MIGSANGGAVASLIARRVKWIWQIGLLVLVFGGAIAVSPAAAAACDGLKGEKIAFTTIDNAELAPPGYKVQTPLFPEVAPDGVSAGPEFCRIRGTIRPTPTSNIKFEVWLPTKWNGRYLQVGNGGSAGKIIYPGLARGVDQGYATASTDDGTSPVGDYSWKSDPERLTDLYHRAVHLTSRAGKVLTAAYYGKPAAHAYFVGGSKGGQEALEEAQRYPEDFNGVVANYPAINSTHMIAFLIWSAQQMNREPGAKLTSEKLQLLNRAALAACAGKDGGLKSDGFLTYPPACHVKPALLQCKGPDAANCLTPAQVKTAAAIYEGPPRDHLLFPVGAHPGGEAGRSQGWAFLDGGILKGLGLTNEDSPPGAPNLDFHNYDWSKDFPALVASQARQGGPASGVQRDDLRAFKARGGKLIITHGWSDTIIPAESSIAYYERVVADQAKTSGRSGLDETRTFARLFMIPGQGHGPSSGLQPVDSLAALAAWVENGQAPEVLSGAQYVEGDPSKGVVLRRDICAWPRVAMADARGAFACRLPK